MIIQKPRMIGGLGPVWRDNAIGGEGDLSPSLTLKSYTLAAGTTQAWEFPYDDSQPQFETVFEGAKQQLNVIGGTAPYTFTSSDSAKAETDSAGLITWHNTGSVSFTVTDSAGKTITVTFSPSRFYVVAGQTVNHATAAANCATLGGIQPPLANLTNSLLNSSMLEAISAVRMLGTLWGEWGDLRVSGWPDLGSSTSGWAAEINENNYAQYFLMSDGSAKNSSATITGGMLGVCELTTKPPALQITQYTTSPGTSQAHTFTFSTDGSIKTVWDGARIQIAAPAGAVAPLSWVSSNTSAASIDANGLVTWHNKGSVMFTITDAIGRSVSLTLAPGLFFKPYLSAWSTYETVTPSVIADGYRIPDRTELSSGVHVRGMGSLYSEWGDFALNGSGWNFSTVAGSSPDLWVEGTDYALFYPTDYYPSWGDYPAGTIQVSNNPTFEGYAIGVK